MKLTWYGHSAFSIEIETAKLLIDPFFTGNPSFREPDRKLATKGVSHIVLTHGHSDHVGDTIEIAKETGATVIANFDLCMWLQANGVESIDPTNTGGTVMHNGFSVTFVQAQHSSAQLDENGVSHHLGDANGVVLHMEGEKTLYHMGDTDIFGDMALIAELHRPQIGIVPVGDRFTMGGAVAALACRRFFDFETVIPCHYGSFPIIDASADAFLAGMEEDAGKVKVMQIGKAEQI